MTNQPRARLPIPEKYRSRLMLSYRTNITGTPLAQRLPFRVLVMGQFTGKDGRTLELVPDLDQRPIRSIQLGTAGTSTDDYMAEMKPWMRLPEGIRGELEAMVPGQITLAVPNTDSTDTVNPFVATIETQVSNSQAAGAFKGRVTGTAQFTSSEDANGVQDLSSADFKVHGTADLSKADDGTISLAEDLVVQVSGAFTTVIANDSGKPIGAMAVVSNDVKITISKDDITLIPVVSDDLGDPNHPAGPARYQLLAAADDNGKKSPKDYPLEAKRALPFLSARGFTPDGVADNIPELHRLRVIRDLVLELASTVRNNPSFRKALRAALPVVGEDPTVTATKLKALMALQTWARAQFPELMVTRPPPAPPEGNGN